MGTEEKKENKVKLELDFELLEAIADYYDFPVSAFFCDKEQFKNKKRKTEIEKRLRELKEKIIELIDSYL